MPGHLTVRYSNGSEKQFQVEPGQSILDAAEAQGVAIVNECRSGVCGTCVGSCASGRYEQGRTEGLSAQERASGKLLTCQTQPIGDCVIDLAYPEDDNAASLVSGEVRVTRVELLSESAALLGLDTSMLSRPLEFQPGQFAELNVPGTSDWRAYSYASSEAQAGELTFLIRLLPDGIMSNYLRDRAKAGDYVAIRGSKGSFYLREPRRPVVLMAGGTGLSAILAIAQHLAALDSGQPVTLLYGVTRPEDLCLTDQLQALADANPEFTFSTIVAQPATGWSGATGVVTDLLNEDLLNAGEVDIYLCGPAPMVEATRNWLKDHDLERASLFYEKFVPSGASTLAPPLPRLDIDSLDLDGVRRDGSGTAVVIGGSLAGIASAKVLLDRFERVIVLEKDSNHDRREGRPGVAQGWHLHHLLTAGRLELERLFPGITDEMVAEGAFKVDMAEQYRLRLVGEWKKPCTSGVEIVCAGRPLLEWCVRRRLDTEPRVDFRYDSEVRDILYDDAANQVLGVGIAGVDGLEVIPAEFVLDASGKNTYMPEFLHRIGIGAPEAEEDIINCFYASMQHKCPPERRWDDKTMVICYAYRPQEETYCAQFFADSSQTTMITSLIQYNCYSPPRNGEEFLEFARKMPSRVIADNIDGLEPASRVFNFRYPNMIRWRYEKKRRLPRNLLVIGDAYLSADPVSGLGMSIALLEVRELQTLLARHPVDSEKLTRAYYRRISKFADRAWFVIREQNLRYDWIPDVKKKRPIYFRAMNWYLDRVAEHMHTDVATYRRFLQVVHLINPPSSLMMPQVAIPVVARWLKARLRGEKTMVERNFGADAADNWNAPLPESSAGH